MVADRERVGELVAALSELPSVDVVVSSGGDDTVELFAARHPAVVVVTASLDHGDARSLIATLRAQPPGARGGAQGSEPARPPALDGGMRAPPPRSEVAIVVVGDDAGPIRTALDALELAPDRFVSRPLSPRALRFAVTGGIDTARAARGAPPPPPPLRPAVAGAATGRADATSSAASATWALRTDTQPGGTPPPRPPRVPSTPPRPPQRPPLGASAAAASPAASQAAAAPAAPSSASPVPDAAASALTPLTASALTPLSASALTPLSASAISPLSASANSSIPPAVASPITPSALAAAPAALPPLSASAITAITPSPPAVPPPPPRSPSTAASDAAGATEPTTRAALRARWEALADSMADLPGDDDDEPPPLPPPLVIKPRRRHGEPTDEVSVPPVWKPGSTDEIAPLREPTLILREPEPSRGTPPLPPVPPPPAPLAPAESPAPAVARAPTGDDEVVVAARTRSDELWSDPMSIPALAEPEPGPGSMSTTSGPVADAAAAPPAAPPAAPDVAPDARAEIDSPVVFTGRSAPGIQVPAALEGFPDELLGELTDRQAVEHDEPEPGDGPEPLLDAGAGGSPPRDFARELRAKMSMMAQRLFHSGGAPAVPADHAPRHDHHTEIDLAALGDDPPLAGVAELEAPARLEPGELATSPGSWDSQVRERGLPDAGMIVRGVSDAAMLLSRMFAQGATGRIGFRRDEVETIVYFDRGRPVFASSNEPRDRMGELLLREGKITASQLERCRAVVAESGRRMGEILVDFGYLKRRELLPAVRRHVEDLVYSLFGWERGTYAITLDTEPCAERIRLSRHPAALILEGIRRKLDRTSLDRLVGSPSTVIEVRDRERLGGIVHAGDLAPEERAALAAFDGQVDLAQIARSAGVDVADVLPLAWSLCVLGLATARRADAELPDEATALVGETDLAIDRERVRARWQLVSEADYFALLGVRRDATGFEIRRAYQSARRDFAADCFPGELRRELARELDDIASVLDEAFRVLRDDRLRQTYLANLVES
ncbi:MAG TPA: DUF4388 domain-containing protein [Kofleriaceae bacterium]|nr:DUF4388 domain-containing protein [Kofleriaceae bacterium]